MEDLGLFFLLVIVSFGIVSFIVLRLNKNIINSIDSVKKSAERFKKSNPNFHDAKKIVAYSIRPIEIMLISKDGYICLLPKEKIFNVRDIISFKVEVNNQKLGGDIGTAIVGGLLFGTVGALVGSISTSIQKIRIYFTLDDFSNSTAYFNVHDDLFMGTKFDKDLVLQAHSRHEDYVPPMENLNNILSTLQVIEKKVKKVN